jgi:putative endonuclease
MEYCVYILFSEKSNKTYVGFTSDLISRFRSHNFSGKKGWTICYRPWRVIFCEFYVIKTEAMQKEAWLKTGHGREWIHLKINDECKVLGFIVNEFS